MVTIKMTVSGNKYTMIRTPRPISEAPMDGTKIIAWFPAYKRWDVAWHVGDNYWMTQHKLMDRKNSPSHFVEYFPDPTEE